MTSRDQVLGSISIVEDDHRTGLETVKHIPQPGSSGELHLDPPTVGHVAGIGGEPFEHLGSGVGIDHRQSLAVDPDPALPPATLDLLRERHWQVVDELVGDDHAPDPVGEVTADPTGIEEKAQRFTGRGRRLDRPHLDIDGFHQWPDQ